MRIGAGVELLEGCELGQLGGGQVVLPPFEVEVGVAALGHGQSGVGVLRTRRRWLRMMLLAVVPVIVSTTGVVRR